MNPRWGKDTLTAIKEDRVPALTPECLPTHNAGEDAFNARFGRLRLDAEILASRKKGQRNWSLSTRCQQLMQKPGVEILIVTDWDGTLVGWAWCRDVQAHFRLFTLPDGAWVVNGPWKPMTTYPEFTKERQLT